MSDTWVTERLHAHYAQSLRVDELLYDSNTEHQRLKGVSERPIRPHSDAG